MHLPDVDDRWIVGWDAQRDTGERGAYPQQRGAESSDHRDEHRPERRLQGTMTLATDHRQHVPRSPHLSASPLRQPLPFNPINIALPFLVIARADGLSSPDE